MRILILACFVIGLARAAQAQLLTIKEQVTRQALPQVTVFSYKPRLSATTDAKGQVDLAGFQQADSIYIRYIGQKSLAFTYAALQEKQFQLFLTENNVLLDAVVVSATRWQQEKSHVPSRMATIQARSSLLHNPQTAADLLALSGEVYIQKSQLGGGSPMIRGFATNRVLLTVDGVRMNTAIFRSGNLQNAISLDPFATERTEVLFGPGSVMYGSDAIAGVMSFYTLTPALAPAGKPLLRGSAVSRWSSANAEKTGHFDLHAGWSKWALVSSASFSDYGDLKMGRRGPDAYLRPAYVARVNGQDEMVTNPDPRVQVQTGYRQFNLMEKIRFRPGPRWDFQYGFHYSTTSDIPRYDRLIRYRQEVLRSAEWYYGPQTWLMNNLSLRQVARTRAYDRLRLNLAHQFFAESRHDRDFGQPLRYHRHEKVQAYAANLDLEKTWGPRRQLSYGAELIYNKVYSAGTDENIQTGRVVPGPSRYPNHAGWHSWASFFSYRHQASEQVQVQVGARYNRFLLQATFDTAFYRFPFTAAHLQAGALTGSAGLVYSPRPSWQLNTNLATGFRSPNVDDVGKVFDSAPGLVVIPNPNLRPEYVYNVDAGAAKTFGSFLKADATVYYTYLDDALVRRDFTLNGQDSLLYNGVLSRVQAIQNAAKAYVWGLQTGVEVKLGRGLDLSARFNYQRGQEELEDGSMAPLRHAAPWFGLSRLSYTASQFKADLYVVYNGAVRHAHLAPEEQDKAYLYASDANGQPYAPAWTTLNLKALYKISDHLGASAGLENITNERYRPYASGIAAPGRNLIFSLRASF